MPLLTLVLSITGTFCGGLALVLLMSGWLGLAPYPLMASGVLLIAGAVVGVLSGSAP